MKKQNQIVVAMTVIKYDTKMNGGKVMKKYVNRKNVMLVATLVLLGAFVMLSGCLGESPNKDLVTKQTPNPTPEITKPNVTTTPTTTIVPTTTAIANNTNASTSTNKNNTNKSINVSTNNNTL